MDKILVTNIFAAVFEKSVLDPFLEILDSKAVKFWGTEGTVRCLKSKGFWARSAIFGFDFDGRVKTLDRSVFARILADRTNKKHLEELRKLARLSVIPVPLVIPAKAGINNQILDPFGSTQGKQVENDWVSDLEPFDLVVVDLYPPNKKNFPESMDIGGQALIRAAIKNYKNVAVAFDPRSLADLAWELKTNKGMTSLKFRKKQVARALKFIARRCGSEAELFSKI